MGNPGSDYRGTYHNLGFRAIDQLRAHYDNQKHDFSPGTIYKLLNSDLHYLGKPDCYVNESGDLIAAWVEELQVAPEEILVIYDDFSLDCGIIRLRSQGGPGGHNGMKSIIDRLNTKCIPRLRIGIGPLPTNMNPMEFVLESIYSDDRSKLENVLNSIPEIVDTIIDHGIEAGMNDWNGVDFRE